MADQEKSTMEILKELMEKMSSLEKQVQEGASCKGGQKQPRDSEGEDSAMPGSSRDGVDNQESEKSDLDPDDELGTTKGDGLSFGYQRKEKPLWRRHLAQNWSIR